MKIFSFADGANPRKGGLGLVGVPWIAKSVAERGHQVVLNIGGYPNPGIEHLIKPDIRTALTCKMGLGNYGIIIYPCVILRWAFSPAMIRPLLPYMRDVDFIILHSTYSFPVLVGYLLARWFHKPYALWPHGVFAPIQRQISARKKKIYGGLIARAIMDNASVLFYSTTGEREETRSLNFKAPSVIVPHGLNFEDFVNLPPRGTFRSRYMAGHSGPLVLFLSRINQKKGLDILARAFALLLERLPNARLAIVGSSDPPQFEDQVMSWIRDSGISNCVVMPGLLVGAEKMQAFGLELKLELRSYLLYYRLLDFLGEKAVQQAHVGHEGRVAPPAEDIPCHGIRAHQPLGCLGPYEKAFAVMVEILDRGKPYAERRYRPGKRRRLACNVLLPAHEPVDERDVGLETRRVKLSAER